MTKKLATLVAMLACCVLGALAQKVATTPVTDVQTGDYLLLVHSDKTAADGSWAYINTSNKNRVSTDAASLGTTAYAGSKIENNAYIWHVEKQSDGKITIQSVAQKTFWPTARGYNKSDYYPQHITTSSSANAFELVALSDGFALKSTTSVTNLIGTKVNSTPTIYVVSNNNSQIGYYGGYDDSKIENQGEIARVEFYEVSKIPDQVSFTYKYVYDGATKKTEAIDAYVGNPYPAVYVPDFIKASAPEGEVKPEDNGATFTIECTSALPFEVTTDLNNPHLYYFESNISTAKRQVMSYSNNMYLNIKNTMLQHGIADDRAINDIRHDLWCVTGNPFDGFKFYNTSSKRYLAYATGSAGKNYLSLQSDGTWGNAFEFDIRDNSSKWNTEEITDGKTNGFAITKRNANLDLDASKEFVNQIAYTDGYVLSYGAADNTGTFLLEEPTYVLPLHDSEADNAAFATTCAPFNFAIVGDDVKAYAGKLSADGKELDMNEIEGNVPANQGVILKAAMGVGEVTVKVVNTADAIDNDLKGTNDEMTDLSQVYVFGRDKVTRHVGFYAAAGDAPLPANRAYLNKPAQEAVNAVAMNFGNGMVTNINTAISAQSADNAPIYDLSGRRVQHTVKGSLYIKGGRKFMAQ